MTTTTPELDAPRSGGTLTGTGSLIRFMVRRDRVRLSLWIFAIAFFTVVSMAALPDLYTTEVERAARAALVQNPAVRAMTGPGFGIDDYTFGAMLANEFLSWCAIFVGLMSIFTIVRHTRQEEETGRAELIRSGIVGRHAPVSAALVVAIGANFVLGLVLAGGLTSIQVESIDWPSSFLFGMAVASVGIVFAAVAAVAAQVTQHSRAANGLAGALLAFAYLVRAAGDMSAIGGGLLSWFSPIGWAQQTRVYVDDRWWPLLLSVGLTAGLVMIAYTLNSRRDLGAGLIQPRPGPAHAPRSLSSAMGLAWRLHRASVLWWSVAIFLFGFGYGGLASEVEKFVSELPLLEEAIAEIGGAIIDAWLAVIITVQAVVVAIFGVLGTLRAKSEESAGRAESILATPVLRRHWMGGHLTIALVGSALLLALNGIGLGLSASRALEDGSTLGSIVEASLAHIPGVWLTIGIAAALYGLIPKATVLIWVLITYAGVVGWLGVLLQFPQWMVNLSPLGHTPLLPAEDMRWTPLVVMTLLAAGLIALGITGFRRRDIQSTA